MPLCSLAAVAFALQTISWQDLSAPAQRLWAELGSNRESFAQVVAVTRARNTARLREGEIDHLVFYLLQSREFTAEPPIDPALAALDLSQFDKAIQQRTRTLLSALANPSDERQRILATLLPQTNPEAFITTELSRVLKWIREKEEGCRSTASPQSCMAALYTTRGHSSDTNATSMIAVKAAFDWLTANGRSSHQRILLIGPGSDFAPRTGSRSGPVQVYQPKLLRGLFPKPITLDCVDINPRVLRSAASECQSVDRLDIAVDKLDRTYDAIIATNVLLYLDRTELLLALSNIRAMLAPAGVLIHNDGRFEANLFGKAVGLPVLHFGSVNLDDKRRPPLVDRFVIHSPAAPKL